MKAEEVWIEVTKIESFREGCGTKVMVSYQV